MKIVCVYKTGGDFTPEYVTRMYDKLKGYDFVCLTDSDELPDYIEQWPLLCNFPGFWSKMELFTVDDDVLYFDLDTVFWSSDIDKMMTVCRDKMIMLSDFYFPEKLQSGVLYIPQDEHNRYIWSDFFDNSDTIMKQFRGDGEYMHYLVNEMGLSVERWDKVLPDYIASYKAHIKGTYPKHLKPFQVDTQHTNVICYHGQPRPHETNWDTGL